jgi:hypothetical protein
MTLRFFNGIQIDVPEGWADVSTVIVAPREEVSEGRKPKINLVVKRRPSKAKDVNETIKEYLAFMKSTLGDIKDVETKEMKAGSVKGTAVRFSSEANGRRFRQITLLYVTGGDEISATVTQLDGDPTPMKTIEKLLQSIRPAAGGVAGLK